MFGVSGLAPAAFMGDLPSTTVAAFAPADFQVSIRDGNISPIDFDADADWVAITGKVNQRRRMTVAADDQRRRGKKLIIGGPCASLSSANVREHCDVLVTGEAEDIAADLFSDLRAGHPRDLYVGDKPDLSRSPAPRWDPYPNDRLGRGGADLARLPVRMRVLRRHRISGMQAAAQADRQCHRRTRPALSDRLSHHLPRRRQFHRLSRSLQGLLEAITAWRAEHPVDFVTQVSIEAARDEELLNMCANAGLTRVFIGIETPKDVQPPAAPDRPEVYRRRLARSWFFNQKWWRRTRPPRKAPKTAKRTPGSVSPNPCR